MRSLTCEPKFELCFSCRSGTYKNICSSQMLAITHRRNQYGKQVFHTLQICFNLKAQPQHSDVN